MLTRPTTVETILDLDRFPVERRAGRLRRAFLLSVAGETFWVAGHGDAEHYQRFLRSHFPGEVEWIADFDRSGRWIARVGRRGA